MDKQHNHKLTCIKCLLWLFIIISWIGQPCYGQAKPQVFIVTTLYKKHDSTNVYNLDTLRKIIESIKADVAVLDVTPAELKEQKVHPDKIEYPGIIFPWLNRSGIPAYGSEPAEPLFTQWVDVVKKGYQRLDSLEPVKSNALKRYRQATYEVLKQVWQ